LITKRNGLKTEVNACVYLSKLTSDVIRDDTQNQTDFFFFLEAQAIGSSLPLKHIYIHYFD